MSLRDALIRGATWWGFFAALSYCFSDTTVHWLRPSMYVPDDTYWNMGLVTLLLMVAGGAVVGALFSLMLPRCGAPLSITLAFGTLMATVARGIGPVIINIAVPLVAAGFLLWTSATEERFRRWWFVVNPVTLSLVLAIRPWLYSNVMIDWNRFVQLGFSFLAVALILAISWWALRNKPVSFRFCHWAAAGLAILSIASGYGFRLMQHHVPLDPRPSVAGRPNIILITLDTTRADHLHLYGYARNTTPNLDHFAQGATLYENSHSAEAWTAPSHASIFTGLYALRHAVRFDPDQPLNAMPAGVPLLPEVLSAQGYRTVGVVANNGYLTAELGFGRGFDFYGVTMPWNSWEAYRAPSVFRWLRHWFLPAKNMDRYYLRSETMLPRVWDAIHQVQSSPFFLFANFMDAHWPYDPPEPYLHRFGDPGPIRTNVLFYGAMRGFLGGTRQMTSAERSGLINAYDGGIAYMDHTLGIFFDQLRQAGLYDSSMIIVTADHGEALGEDSLVSHGYSVEGYHTHVPLVIKYPGQTGAVRVTAPVSGVDLYPTILTAAGAPVGRYPAGVPLQRLPNESSRPIFAESYSHGDAWGANEKFHRIQRAIFQQNWKLVESTTGARALFDMNHGEAGPDVSAQQPELVHRMSKILHAWEQNLAPVTANPGLDKESLDRLKSLGYIQ